MATQALNQGIWREPGPRTDMLWRAIEIETNSQMAAEWQPKP